MSLRCQGKVTLIMPFYFFEWLGIWGVCFVLFFCCKANLSIIGNAKQVEFTVLLINYFLIQLWIIDFQTCMRHHFASKLSGEESSHQIEKESSLQPLGRGDDSALSAFYCTLSSCLHTLRCRYSVSFTWKHTELAETNMNKCLYHKYTLYVSCNRIKVNYTFN